MKTKLLALIGLLAIVVGHRRVGLFPRRLLQCGRDRAGARHRRMGAHRLAWPSVARHATDTPPASLDDAATVRAGAKAFSERGCANCHGGPGVNGRNSRRACGPTRPISRRS